MPPAYLCVRRGLNPTGSASTLFPPGNRRYDANLERQQVGLGIAVGVDDNAIPDLDPTAGTGLPSREMPSFFFTPVADA